MLTDVDWSQSTKDLLASFGLALPTPCQPVAGSDYDEKLSHTTAITLAPSASAKCTYSARAEVEADDSSAATQFENTVVRDVCSRMFNTPVRSGIRFDKLLKTFSIRAVRKSVTDDAPKPTSPDGKPLTEKNVADEKEKNAADDAAARLPRWMLLATVTYSY